LGWCEGEAEVDGLASAAAVDLREFVVGAGEADLESFYFAEPAFAFGFGDAGGEVSRISVIRGCCAGSGQSMGHRRQACSWTQGVGERPAAVPD